MHSSENKYSIFDTTQEVHPGIHAVAILRSRLSDKACYKFDASIFPQDHGSSFRFNRSAKLRCFSQDEQRNAVKRNVMGTDDRLRSQTFALSFIFKINSKSSVQQQFSSSAVQQFRHLFSAF